MTAAQTTHHSSTASAAAHEAEHEALNLLPCKQQTRPGAGWVMSLPAEREALQQTGDILLLAKLQACSVQGTRGVMHVCRSPERASPAASGLSPDALHLMFMNFSSPMSAPKPACTGTAVVQ
jgi:hypothetical protein